MNDQGRIKELEMNGICKKFPWYHVNGITSNLKNSSLLMNEIELHEYYTNMILYIERYEEEVS